MGTDAHHVQAIVWSTKGLTEPDYSKENSKENKPTKDPLFGANFNTTGLCEDLKKQILQQRCLCMTARNGTASLSAQKIKEEDLIRRKLIVFIGRSRQW